MHFLEDLMIFFYKKKNTIQEHMESKSERTEKYNTNWTNAVCLSDEPIFSQLLYERQRRTLYNDRGVDSLWILTNENMYAINTDHVNIKSQH